MLNCGVPLQPRNLLDNSDFRNPVNQRGKTSYNTEGYTIDRWYFYNPNGDGTVTINNGYISLTGGSGAVSLSCRFPKGFLDANKTYTARICDNLGNINPTGLVFYDSFDSFELSAGAGETKNVVWAALYEGAYDASTLPAYQPKGYAAELAEAQRYYQTIPALTHIPGVTNTATSFGAKHRIPTMRIAPTVSIASGQEVSIYTGDYSATTANYTMQYASKINQITFNVSLSAGSFVAYKPGELTFPVDIVLSADL